MEGTLIQEAVIGTCTNGRLRTWRWRPASWPAGKPRGAPHRKPASRQVLMDAMDRGVAQRLIEGAAFVTDADCGHP